MMPLRRLRSIRDKLLALVLAANIGTLLAAGGMLLYNDLREYRRDLETEIRVQADIMGLATTSALEFNDAKAANENLALLKIRPEIVAAAIYTANGKPFARFVRAGTPPEMVPALAGAEGVSTENGELILFKRVATEHEILGTVFMRAHIDLRHRLQDYLVMLSVVIAGSLLIGIAISTRLQASVANPILAVSAVARQVMQNRDFTLRAPRSTEDEVAELVDAFNDMLAEIGLRTTLLEESKLALEREIGERRATQHLLAGSELRHRSLVAAMTSLVWTSNTTGSFTAPQPAWQTYTGQSPEAYGVLGWRSAFHPDDQATVDRQWVLAINRREQFEFAARLYHTSSARYREISLRAVPVRDDEGALVEWIGTVTDVDDQRTAEREVRTLNEQLEGRVAERTRQLQEANRELESFSYSVSHDLRAPLRAISGFAEMLTRRHGKELSPEALRLLGVVVSEAGRMGMLIDDLLALGPLGRQATHMATIDMRGLALSVFEQLPHQDVAVDWQLGMLPGCWGDIGLLRQVWVNLLSNALKFTSKTAQPHIEVGAVSDADKHTYFVRDNGVGFDVAHQAKLFGVFQRLHSDADFPGNGVGLALVQRIVTRHGGSVWADGKLGEGATFYFTVPRNQETDAGQ
jgi:PAS domain S-box-containing protein